MKECLDESTRRSCLDHRGETGGAVDLMLQQSVMSNTLHVPIVSWTRVVVTSKLTCSGVCLPPHVFVMELVMSQMMVGRTPRFGTAMDTRRAVF